MRLQIDQPTRARDGRMLGRDLVETQPQKAAERERIRRAPRNAPLGIDALEVADQQQTEIGAWRETRSSTRRRIERGALRLDERVEGVVVQDTIQSLIERVRARRRQLIGGNPQPRRPCAILATTHGHGGSVVRRIERVDRV